MSDLFTNKPRLCRCKGQRVDTGDTVQADRRTVIAHGLFHCFAYQRAR